MKKITILISAAYFFIGTFSNAQDIQTEVIIKKQQYCSAEITMRDKSVTKYAIGGFKEDSIIVYPIQVDNKNPRIHFETEIRIAASDIKNISVRIEHLKNAPSINSSDSSFKSSTNRTIASSFKKYKSNRVINNTSYLLGSEFYDPFSIVIGTTLLPVAVPLFILMAKEKKYRINGNPEKLYKMEMSLTNNHRT